MKKWLIWRKTPGIVNISQLKFTINIWSLICEENIVNNYHLVYSSPADLIMKFPCRLRSPGPTFEDCCRACVCVCVCLCGEGGGHHPKYPTSYCTFTYKSLKHISDYMEALINFLLTKFILSVNYKSESEQTQ